MVGEGTQVSKVETNFIFMKGQKPLEKQGKDFPTKGLQSRQLDVGGG